jgi:hypothetical protein
MKRVIIVHGWAGNPKQAWFPWIEKELKTKGFEVIIPKMPNTLAPKIDEWVEHLSKTVGKLDKDTFFIARSIGCQTIMRYLEKIKEKAGGCVFVGPWFTLTGIDDEEDYAIAKPWLEIPIDFKKVKETCKQFTCIFSDDDPFVPVENAKMFKKKIGAKTIMLTGYGHFGDDEKITKLPIAVEEFLKLTS